MKQSKWYECFFGILHLFSYNLRSIQKTDVNSLCPFLCFYAGKPNLRLPMNACDQEVIHEVCSPSSDQTLASPASSLGTSTSPHSPQSETFHWPHVQELRSKYTDAFHSLKRNCVCTEPEGLKESRSCHKYRSSSDLHIAPTDCCKNCREDWAQQKKRSPLCRWSSLDHILGSVPLHEVQNLQEPSQTRSLCDRIQDEDGLLQDVLNSTKSLSSGKSSESNLVKSLRDKFQGLSTS